MVKQFTLAVLLLFGLSALPTLAADAGSEGTQAEKPKEKTPEGSTKEKKKDGDKKGDDEPSCEN